MLGKPLVGHPLFGVMPPIFKGQKETLGWYKEHRFLPPPPPSRAFSLGLLFRPVARVPAKPKPGGGGCGAAEVNGVQQVEDPPFLCLFPAYRFEVRE